MKKNFTLFFAASFSLAIIACQKEVEDTDPVLPAVTGDITGTWRFISIDAKTTAINETSAGSDVLKTVTTSDYITENNSGTVTIDATTITATNLSYSVNSLAKSSIYENGVLTDTFSFPFQSTIPSVSSMAPYTRIGADSVYFQSGSSFTGGVTQNSQPSGARIRLEQDKLYFIQSVVQTTTNSAQGQTMTATVQAAVTVTLQR